MGGARTAAGGAAPLGGQNGFPSITAQSASDIKTRLRVFWVACATEDCLFDGNNQKFIWSKEKGLKPTAKTPGVPMVWRDNLTSRRCFFRGVETN